MDGFGDRRAALRWPLYWWLRPATVLALAVGFLWAPGDDDLARGFAGGMLAVVPLLAYADWQRTRRA